MKIGIICAGARERSIGALLELAAQENELFYRMRRDARPIDEIRPPYIPDTPASEIMITLAESIGPTTPVSCGSAAAAYVGWLRARGDDGARVRLVRIGPSTWHAVAILPRPGGPSVVWDPKDALARKGAA